MTAVIIFLFFILFIKMKDWFFIKWLLFSIDSWDILNSGIEFYKVLNYFV